MADVMNSVYTVHKYQQWDDTDWSNPVGFVTSFETAYLWAKQEVNQKMKEWLRTAEELNHQVQLIETADQFNYFVDKVGYFNSLYEGRDMVKFPIILPAHADDWNNEFEIIYYIGVESSWNAYIDVLRWKFVKVYALPVVVTRRAE